MGHERCRLVSSRVSWQADDQQRSAKAALLPRWGIILGASMASTLFLFHTHSIARLCGLFCCISMLLSCIRNCTIRFLLMCLLKSQILSSRLSHLCHLGGHTLLQCGCKTLLKGKPTGPTWDHLCLKPKVSNLVITPDRSLFQPLPDT